MRLLFLIGAIGLAMLGCDSKEAPKQQAAARAPLVDLAGETSLAAVRTAFNAHAGEARFLTLLSPT